MKKKNNNVIDYFTLLQKLEMRKKLKLKEKKKLQKLSEWALHEGELAEEELMTEMRNNKYEK